MKYAIVTGASTGIGQKTAIDLAKNGFQVGLVGRNQSRLEETLQLIGGKGEIMLCDLGIPEEIIRLTKEIVSKGIKVDLLANIAGIWHGTNEVYAGRNLDKFDDRTVTETINVGTVCPILMVKNLLPIMNDGGLIVNLTGTFENGGKGWLPYYVSKRALEDFTVGLIEELAETKIRVAGVSPSDTATESYVKFLPQYVEESQDPEAVAQFIVDLYTGKEKSGKIWVIKKDTEPFAAFHY